jgi:hypothetical protein
VNDPVHLAYAIGADRLCLTRNYGDFQELHHLLMVAKGHHPGILPVRRDNDPRRNLSPHDIARALRELGAAGVPLVDCCYVLNHWQ